MVVIHPPPFRRSSDREYKVPPEILSQLQQIEWCLPTLNDPSFIPLNSYSRTPPPHLVGRYTFMSKTLSTDGTVRLWQAFYRRSTSDNELGELRVFAALGGDMDGHLNTAHGGVAATLLDEAMGSLAGIHKEPGKSIFTAYMRVDYKKPVPTPSFILIRITLDPKSATRKIFVNGTIESGNGVVYTGGEALFLEVERKHRPKI
jgi:thioesterase superfamily protein 4